ncbi:unnamed protein product, partial [Mesorhabditis belari]|uniref:Mitogen-activated protein kinase kinase kinase n=1 Tax=Mesorhabditis belari TaxID=2138241 RepID=A0AAF3EYQ4_9BILA
MSDEDREIPLTLSTGNFGQSQARARQVVSPAPDKTGSPASRRLQVVLVMDLKVQKNLRSRELAANDVQKVTDQLNVQLTKLEFDRLDFGETNTLDTFYSADVALVDVSVPQQQASLCYHIGVRESMGQNYNLILTLLDETDNKLETLKQTLRHQILVYFTTPDSAHLMSTEKKEGVDFGESTNLTKSDCIRGKIVQFKHRLKMALKNVQVEANAHSREKFLSDIRKVREITDVSEANAFLDKMRIRLDNPDVLSVDTVHQLLLGYRDKQNYEGMISLIDELKKVPGCGVLQAQAIRFLYAFALNRRNKGNDRDRSLETVLKIMTDAEKVKDGKDPKDALSPDMICLAGRIYKDKFCASGYEDKSSLDSAIQWYRKAFELSPLEYSGINLATLLRASGETFENNPEMSRIGLVLNSLLGRKGALQSLQDYWDVATFFEVSVLAEDYSKACQAALRMSQLKPPVWHLRSTMENIKLINRCAATMSPIEKDKQQFLFWTEFFMEATESETAPIHCARFPVLIQELKQFTPSFLTMNVQEGSIILSHVLENSQQKKPPPGIHRWHFTSGTVYAARDLTTQRQIVVKEIEVKFDEEVQPLMEEIQLHSTLLHQNIVQYLGCDLLKRDTGNDVFLIFMEHVPGTLVYMAPEVIDHGQRGYGAPADIWSFGCTCVEMVTGKPPFLELLSPEAALFRVGMFKCHPPIPEERLSERCVQFIKSCFEPEAMLRPTASKLYDEIGDILNRTYSASPVDPPSVCSSPNPMFLPFSQPNSPISDDIQQPQLVTSPGSVLSTPMSVGHGPLLNRTISDETGHQRFFMLKKDSERRHYLARFMNEEKDEIVNIWFTQLMHTAKSSPCVTRNMLMTLLMGMKDYLVYKNNEKIQDALNEIRHQLDYEPTSVSQINLALYAFSDAMQPVLRKQIIKPHWMFALDNLIRSAVQAAVQILSPDLSAVLQVHDVAATPSSTATGQRPSVSRDSAVSEGDATDSRPPSAPPAFESTVVREKRENIRGVHDDNKQLFDHLLEVEKELNTLLQIIITDKKRKIANLKEFTERPELMISQLPSLSTLPNGLTNGGSTQSIQPISNGSSPRTSVPRSTEEVVSWLRSLDVDDHSIQCVLREGYSKSDLLEYVTREELRQCGVSGGSSCRIFRACQEVRDRSRRGQAFLSAPLRSRDDSLDDYHSSIAADEMGNPDHFHH